MAFRGKNLLTQSPVMCPDTFRKNLPLRKIALYKAEWWTYFLKDIQYRGFTVISNDESSCLMDYRKRNRVHLEVQTKADDLWLYPKFHNHPFFLKVFFTGIGSGFLIFLGIMFLLFDTSIFSTKSVFFWLFFVMISVVFVIVSIGVLLSNKGRMTGQPVPVYSTALMDLYQAARFAEKKVLERHFSPEDSPSKPQTFCPECGKAMEPAWTTCPFCGTSLYYK